MKEVQLINNAKQALQLYVLINNGNYVFPSLYCRNYLWFCFLNHNKWLGYCGIIMDQNLKFYNVLTIS